MCQCPSLDMVGVNVYKIFINVLLPLGTSSQVIIHMADIETSRI